MKSIRYRYLMHADTPLNSKLSEHHLFGGNNLADKQSCLRISIPISVKLTKDSGDRYSTTESDLLIKDLNPVVMVRKNGKLVKGKIEETQIDTYCLIKFGRVSRETRDWYYSDELRNKHWQLGFLRSLPTKDFDKCPYPKKDIYSSYQVIADGIRDIIKTCTDRLGKKEPGVYAEYVATLTDEQLIDIYNEQHYMHTCDHVVSEEFDENFFLGFVLEEIESMYRWEMFEKEYVQ